MERYVTGRKGQKYQIISLLVLRSRNLGISSEKHRGVERRVERILIRITGIP